MQTPNMKQLECFCAVVEKGGFTAASEALYLAQSTISGHVSALEKDLGVMLLARGKRGVTLTEEGHRVYQHAKAVLENCREMARELDESSENLTLAASSVPLQYILPQKIGAFCQEYPKAFISLRGGDSEMVHKALLNGEAQLGFAGAMLDMKSMQYTKVADDPLMLVTPKTERYLALAREGKTGLDLLGEPLVFREGGSGTQMAGQRYFTENAIPIENLHIVACMDNSEAVIRSVESGLGCAVVSGLAVQGREGLLTFPMPGKSNSRPLYMLWVKGQSLSKTARAFAALFES